MTPSSAEIEAAATAISAHIHGTEVYWFVYKTQARLALTAAEKVRLTAEVNAGNSTKAAVAAARIREARTEREYYSPGNEPKRYTQQSHTGAVRMVATLENAEVHTCSEACPCQHGGEPVSDFVEARTQYSREAIHLCRSWNPPDPFVDDCPAPRPPAAWWTALALIPIAISTAWLPARRFVETISPKTALPASLKPGHQLRTRAHEGSERLDRAD